MIKKTFKKTGRILVIFIGLVLVFLLVLMILHRILLAKEQKDIDPNGQIVKVNGHDMHVYVDGDNTTAPLLVFLSGAGTTAPVYDFKPLYSLLSDEYRIAVVEKAGYGYSEVADVARDVDTMLSETRMALSLLGEHGPYILLPHSMSGLEALRWAQLYPDEIKSIIGIDIAVPSAYEHLKISHTLMKTLNALTWIGIQRVYWPVSDLSLTQDESKQANLLAYRNAYDKNMLAESLVLFINAETVKDGGIPDVPMLLLVSNGLEVGGGNTWIPCQEAFARQSNARIEYFCCGHYLHQHEPEKVATLCKVFITTL